MNRAILTLTLVVYGVVWSLIIVREKHQFDMQLLMARSNFEAVKAQSARAEPTALAKARTMEAALPTTQADIELSPFRNSVPQKAAAREDASARGGVLKRYADFLRRSSLQLEARENLVGLLAEREQLKTKLLRALGAQGLSSVTPDEFSSAYKQAYNDNEQRIQALLGDSAAALFKYSDNIDYSESLRPAITHLSYSRSPLSDEQIDQLVVVLQGSSSRVPVADSLGFTHYLIKWSPEFASRASHYLSPEQSQLIAEITNLMVTAQTR